MIRKTKGRTISPYLHWALLATVALGPVDCGTVTPLNTADGGGGDTGGGADVAMLTVDQACAQMATALCDAIDTCASFSVRLLYGDKATCVSRQSLGCTGDQSVPDMTRTVADIVACSQAAATASCPDLLASNFPVACLVKPGSRVNGTACGSDWQCLSTYCNKPGQCGVCAPRAALTGACTVDGGCQTGMLCANGKCVLPGVMAAACSDNQPCRNDLYCTKSGTCTAKLGAAGSCMDTDKACDMIHGIACNPLNKICQSVNVASGGDACGLISGTLTICVGLNPCPGISLLKLTAVCANPAGDGEACGATANGVNCVGPANCDMGICRLPSALSCN